MDNLTIVIILVIITILFFVAARTKIIKDRKDIELLANIATIVSLIATILNIYAMINIQEKNVTPSSGNQSSNLRTVSNADKSLKICEVPDIGGIDDRSFNETAWKGVQDAQIKFGINSKYLESQQASDYEKNINTFINEKCDLIVTIGYLLNDATRTAAEKNPNQKFAIVDESYESALPNLLGMSFASDQAAFLAGYIAAGTTKTGKVGTFGGLQIPSVTAFMDGFYYGVKYYNQQNNKAIEVLGWDPIANKGLFTGNFESSADGEKMGQMLLNDGADIIMPVAGPLGFGTAKAVRDHGNAWVIGVDSDWVINVPQYKNIVLTSVMKNSNIMIYNATEMVVNSNFRGGNIIGNLENGGVGLGTIANIVTPGLIQKVNKVKEGIIDNQIKTSQ